MDGQDGAQGPTGKAGSFLTSGYEIVQSTNAVDATSHWVACPGTKKAIGGGASSIDRRIRSSYPPANGTGWFGALEGNDGPVTVYAICVAGS